MMVMHVGIISAVDQYLFTYSIYSHSDLQYLYHQHVYPSHGQG
jgi:hypothetical protein